jgi:hypothetical protein
MKGKSLIAIFTCNRLFYLKWFLPDYLAFCNNNPKYDFVVALDGNDTPYIEFCEKNNIPLVWSKERLGVGISKNRVLTAYPNYDNYFFLDDDAELLNPEIFDILIYLSEKTNIAHFSLGAGFGFKEITGKINLNKYQIVQSLYGSGQFSFFNGDALRKVGGWHPIFSKFKRGGHTEHTHRFYNAGLSHAPFHHIPELNTGYMNWHSPEHVTNLTNVETSANSRLLEEEKLISRRLKTYPVETLSRFYSAEVPLNISRDDIVFDLETTKDIILKIVKNPFFSSEEKSKAVNLYISEKEEEIQKQKKELEEKKFLIELIENSGSYKLAQGISKPLSLVKKVIP